MMPSLTDKKRSSGKFLTQHTVKCLTFESAIPIKPHSYACLAYAFGPL